MKCKRLSAAILSLVMIISLLPTTALAAEENDVWSTAYDEIRVYMDDATKADHDNLKGILPKQVRLYTSKALLGEYVFCTPGGSYWKYSNRGKLSQNKVTANDITNIDLARDKATGHSPTISIPIEGNTKYKVTVSEGKGGKYLRIYISRRTPHNVTYKFSDPAPDTVSAPEDSTMYTETSPVTLLDPAKTSVTGTLNGKDGTWTFKGWTLPDGVAFTDDTHAKFTMPDTNVTVTGTWTFEATPPTGTHVYVYFQTVNTAGDPIENVKGVTPNKNGGGWATLGKLTTTADVATANAADIGKEVKDVNDDPNTNFERYKVNGNVINGNVGISLIDWESIALEPNGAADYVGFDTEAWHLNGKVNVYKLSYNANPPDGVGVEAVTGMPDSAYYLPDWEATVSKVVPTLQGYVFGGWYKDSDCKIEAGDKVAVTEDTDLYAKWTPAQPTTDFGSVVITGPAEIAKSYGAMTYEVPYTATYTMSDNLLRMLQNAPHGVPMTFVVELDSRLTAKKDAATDKFLYDFDGAGILEVDKSSITVSPDGHTITVVCKPTADWKKALEGKTSVVMKLDGTGVLAATDFAVGEYLKTTGHIEGTIPVGGTLLPVKISANVCQTKMTAQTYTVTYDANGGSGTMTDKNSPYADGAVATVLTNGFTRSRYTFTGWNTKADGSGKSYAEGDPIEMLGNVVLYAQWSQNSSRDDDDDKYFFAIQKMDAQDGHALNGAKFELYQRDSRDNKLAAFRKTTASWGTESGIALFSVSATKTSDGGSTWYYREITAPEGYVLDSTEHKIKATNFSDSRSTAVQNAVTVRNYRGTTPDLLNDSDHFAYVIGYMDGNVRPYGLISRAETTTIFFRLLKDSVRDGNLLTSNTYTDVADDYWANTAISTMTGLGIVQGRSTTTFDPKAPITRAQFAAICARFDTGKSNGEQTFSDIQGHWAEKYIQRAAELGWIKGFEDGTFRPDTYITRAQAMTMINRVLNRIPEDESDLLPGMNVWPDCNPGDWFYLAVQEATNSHDFKHKAGNYETWTGMNKDPDWTRYEN